MEVAISNRSSKSVTQALAIGSQHCVVEALVSSDVRVSVYLAPPSQVSAICGGEDILGCYGDDRLVAPGEDMFEVSAESVITHEYGHHIAANRSNAPWRALA